MIHDHMIPGIILTVTLTQIPAGIQKFLPSTVSFESIPTQGKRLFITDKSLLKWYPSIYIRLLELSLLSPLYCNSVSGMASPVNRRCNLREGLLVLAVVIIFLSSLITGVVADEMVIEDVFPLDSTEDRFSVPSIVHQTYDYQSPNFFLYLSLLCVQRFVKPDQHILWVNDEGRFRKGHWDSWQQRAVQGTWEHDLVQLISNKKIDVKFLTFPSHPPGNTSTFAPEKAHRSDFVRMLKLEEMGGIYLDTDAFPIQSINLLRVHNFTLSFDNIVNPDKTAPKRLNNGVVLSAPHAPFLKLWIKHYAQFNPASFDYDSSVVPYRLATEYPDLIHLEMHRISPLSFAFQTSRIADALTCGIYVPPHYTGALGPPDRSSSSSSSSNSDAPMPRRGAIWAPVWGADGKGYTFKGTRPDEYMYSAMRQRLVLHLTMTQVR